MLDHDLDSDGLDLPSNPVVISSTDEEEDGRGKRRKTHSKHTSVSILHSYVIELMLS